MQLPRHAEPARILPVAAVDDVAERFDPLLRILIDPDRAPCFAIDQCDLLAAAQIFDGGGALLGGDAIDDATAGAAVIEPEYQAGSFRRAAVHERIDAERAVSAEQPRIMPLDIVEARPPHQRAITEHPKVIRAGTRLFAHEREGRVLTAPRLSGGACPRNRRGAEMPHYHGQKAI